MTTKKQKPFKDVPQVPAVTAKDKEEDDIYFCINCEHSEERKEGCFCEVKNEGIEYPHSTTCINVKIDDLKLKENKLKEGVEVKLPIQDKLISEFAREVCSVMVKYDIGIFYKPNEQSIVEVTLIEDKKKFSSKYLGFKTVSGHRFINIAENRVITGTSHLNKRTNEMEFKKKSMNGETAKTVLLNDVWPKHLRHIERIFTVPIPILYNGELTFPKHGHDKRFDSWTPEGTPKIDKDLPIEKANKTIEKLYAEFCFKDVQSKINAIAQLMGQFCQGLYKSFRTRTPITFWEGNRPRVGKDYGADIPCLVFEGMAIQDPPISTNIKGSNATEELRKKVTTMLMMGRRRFHSANNRGYIRNEVLEALATLEFWADRKLGGNTEVKLPNEMFLSMSANIGYSASPDFIERCRFIRLHLAMEDVNKRKFNNPLLHEWILNNRGLILSSLYAFVREWYAAGMPKGKTLFSSYPNWAEVVGGIMVFNKLGDPCIADDNTGITGDLETKNMKSFFECAYARFPEEWKTKRELINFIIESENLELFPNLKLDERSGQTRFAFLIEKYVGRIMSDIRLTKDNTISRAARQPYRFTKDDEKHETQAKIGGNGGNVGNQRHPVTIVEKDNENNKEYRTLPKVTNVANIDSPPYLKELKDYGDLYPIDKFIEKYGEETLKEALSKGVLFEPKNGFLKVLE